jgi:TonB family protein
MNAETKVKFCIVGASVALHLVILFCVVFKVAAAELQLEEATPLRIVDLTEYVEAPPAQLFKPRVKEVPPEIEPEEVQDEIAETIVETEEEQHDNQSAALGAFSEGVASEGAGAKYIKENYSYVQRRILQELVYPSQARRTGIQGVVEVIFTINANGSASDIGVRRSSGKDILDEEALRAVQSASPFRRPPEPVRIVIPVSFKLT